MDLSGVARGLAASHSINVQANMISRLMPCVTIIIALGAKLAKTVLRDKIMMADQHKGVINKLSDTSRPLCHKFEANPSIDQLCGQSQT